MATIEQLLAEREIMRGLGMFARILDEKRWDDLGDVFAADLSFDYGSGEDQHGLDALRTHMTRFLDRCGGTQHLIGSVIVDVDGDHAVSRAYVQARHQRRGDVAGPVFDSNGEYRDQWRRLEAGWRIVRRDVRWFMHVGDATILGAGSEDLG